MSPSTAMIGVEGRRTRVRVDGDRADTPVVLIHGIGRSMEDWAPQFPLLSEGHRLIAMDLPGSGFTQRCASPTSLVLLAQSVLATLDELGEHRPLHVLGNSLGGAVAQQLSALAPERVASLVLVSSAGFGKELALPLRLLSTRFLGRFMATHPTKLTALMGERMLYATREFATPSRVDHALAVGRNPGNAEVMWETARALATARGGVRHEWRAPLTAQVAAAGKPTLLIWGDRDRVLPARHLEAARRSLPHASSHLFVGTGHLPQVERADEFATLVLDFIASVDRANLPPKSRRNRRATTEGLGA